ncbi:MAG: endonuclease MutS2 [Myxococcota bacterium]
MPFSVTQKTLERLEWSAVLARLAGHLRTPGARARLAPREGESVSTALFEMSESGVRERLAETAEAATLRERGEHLPIGEVAPLSDALGRARRGGALGPRDLLDVASAVGTVHAARRFLTPRADTAPLLADRAAGLADHGDFEREVTRCIDPSGEVKDEASDALALARRTARELAGEITARIERILRNEDIAGALSDRYFTVRNDRYVLPVRADAKGQVRGIVHDASGSGTTLYVEPEALVDPNNRHKQAEIDAEREIERVLRRLSGEVAELADDLETDLVTLAHLDLAFARAALADEMEAVAPRVEREGVIVLPQLRHPAIPKDQAVPNDLRLGESFHVLVVSGPNAGGKTVAMKAVALAALLVRSGLHVPAAAGARVDLFDAVLGDIGDEQSIGESLSTFSAHMANLARIVDAVDATGAHSLVVLDEIGVGTDPGEGAAIAQAVLETLADAGARVVATTHYGLLKEMADTDPRFENASVEFDPETLAPTYRLRMGFPGSSSATAVAARMGLRQDVLDRAHRFLEREDRQLDRMLSELATSRAALEQEQRVAVRLRKQTESARDEYRRKLAALQERRDKLYRALRDELDESFRDARAQIAAVIRDLQKGGRAQDAARARERLEKIQDRAKQAEDEVGAPREPSPLVPMDWQHARAGDAVQIAGGGAGLLQALPDKRGRVVVSVGGARITVPAERVGRGSAAASSPKAPKPRVALPAPEPDAGDGRCDLRGLRVDEALDQLAEALDRATAGARARLLVVHGIGTGALRRAVREALRASRYVKDVEPAAPDEGGDGATVAVLS